MIASAYFDKASKWQQNKSEDGQAPKPDAVFMTECQNTTEDVKLKEEMDNPINVNSDNQIAI